MGKSLITSYAALGVGLALVLTFGLTAISSVNQVYDSADRAVFTVTEPDQNLRSGANEPAGEASTSEPPVPSAPPEMKFEKPQEGNVSSEAGTGMGDEATSEVPMMAAPAQEESSRENYAITTEVPAASNPLAGILMALPYVVAAAVGSAVFAVTRRRVEW